MNNHTHHPRISFLTLSLLLASSLLCSSLIIFNGDDSTSVRKKKANYGIDVSHHNGNIQWSQVPKDILFVYVKATEGASHQDDKYSTNITEARKRGLKVGSYHYFRMTSSARKQFNNFKASVKKNEQDLIPMIDVETSDGKSHKALCDSLKVFARLLQNYYGKKPMIYAPLSIYNDLLAPTFNSYHLYIGRYANDGSESFIAPDINGEGHYSIWQYTEKGIVPGIAQRVDMARFHPDYSIANISM